MSEIESQVHFFFILPIETAREAFKLWVKKEKQVILPVVLTNGRQEFVAFEAVLPYIGYKKLQIFLTRHSFNDSVFEMREEISPFVSKLAPYFLNEFMESHPDFTINGVKL